MTEEKDPHLKKIVNTVKNITKGHFEESIEISASGIVGELAIYINQTLENLRHLDKNLDEGAKDAPLALSQVKSVSQDTEQASLVVLDKTEGILGLLGDIDGDMDALRQAAGEGPLKAMLDTLDQKHRAIEAQAFEIINSQEFQDITQQKISRALDSLGSIEKRLIDLLIIFKIREDKEHSEENVELLKHLHDDNFSETNKQNLVEQLLSEFGI